MKTSRGQSVIVVSSHVARGSVGNRAAVFALETLGHTVWAVPTVILAWHPGHGKSTRIVPDAEQFRRLLADLEGAEWLGEVGAILSGYLGSEEQVGAVASLVRSVKVRNRGALYLCDPVIGDAGGLYVPEAIACGIRDRLIPLADIATPNLHELAWLAGGTQEDLEAVARAARRLGPPTVLVTSAPCPTPGDTGTLLVSANEALLAHHSEIAGAPNGPGDVAAALFLARKLAGEGDAQALQQATASVFEVLARATRRGSDELMLAADANSLSHPTTTVHLERLSATATVRG